MKWTIRKLRDRDMFAWQAMCRGQGYVKMDHALKPRVHGWATACVKTSITYNSTLSLLGFIRYLEEMGWHDGLCPECAKALIQTECPGHHGIRCGVPSEVFLYEEKSGRRRGYCRLHAVQLIS